MALSVILNWAPGKTALSNLLWRMRILRQAAVIHQMMMMCEDFCDTCRSPFVLVKIGDVLSKNKNCHLYSNMPTAERIMGLSSEGSKECSVGCVENHYKFSVNECCRMRPCVDPVLTSIIEAFLTSNVTMLQIRLSHLIMKAENCVMSCKASVLKYLRKKRAA